MVHVFLLVVYLGTGDDRRLVSDNMYFRDVNRCNWFASQVVKRYGNYSHSDWMHSKDRATAYCLPKYINEDVVNIY